MSMQAILAASQSMSRMQTMQSSRSQMQGKANVLLVESKQDGGNEKKEQEASALKEKSNEILGDIMNEVADVNEALKPNEEITAEEAAKKEAEKTAQPPKTDTLELSDSATVQNSSISNVQVAAAEEIVTYKADGSTTPSVPEKSTSAFKATA